MSFVAPLWLAAAAAVAIGLVVAHLFSTSVPQRDYLPTVRFVPEGAPMAVMRTRRLSDIALLLLRLLAVALFGLALAGAYMKRGGPARVVLVDASRAVGAFTEARDSALAATGDVVFVVFDTSARVISRDSLEGMTASGGRGSLSAAIAAAHRSVARVSAGREDIELVIVSPAVREEVDSATARLLGLWQGPVRHVRVATAAAPVPGPVSVRAMGDDPVAAAVASRQLPRFARDDSTVTPGFARDRAVIPSAARNLQFGARVVRTAPTGADSLWARDGGVLVVWPVAGDGLAARAVADTQNAVAAGQAVVVSSFVRAHRPRAGRVVARWVDGEAAATEVPLGSGCVREVAIPVDPVGDVALRDSFRGLLETLTEPCDGARDFSEAVIPSAARNLQGSAPHVQIPRSARDDRMATWLAALALAMLIAEQFLRTRARAVA